jgi:hypothetical protein
MNDRGSSNTPAPEALNGQMPEDRSWVQPSAPSPRGLEVSRKRKLLPKAIVSFSGSRDQYQLAWAMQEAGLLERLVTDLYFRNDTSLGSKVCKWFPKLMARHSPGVPGCRVTTPLQVMADSLLMKTGLASRQRQVRLDRSLGRRARALAWRLEAPVFSYSYYAASAFQPGPRRPALSTFRLYVANPIGPTAGLSPAALPRALWRNAAFLGAESTSCHTVLLRATSLAGSMLLEPRTRSGSFG